MGNLTVTCSCKTIMVPVETLGAGHYRCPKCRTRVHVDTPFGQRVRRCRMGMGNLERCPEKVAGEGSHLCEAHADQAIAWMLLNTERRDAWADRIADSSDFQTLVKTANERREAREQARQERALRLPSFVYYVRLRPGCIKIGRSIDVSGRMNSFRVWNKEALLAVEPGAQSTEKQRHRQFAHIRQRNDLEEFDEAPDLMEHIAAVRSGHGEPWQAIDRMRTLAHRKKERAEGRIE